MNLEVRPISFWKDIVGAKESELKAIGAVITHAKKESRGVANTEDAGLRKLDAMLVKRQQAQKRRRWNRGMVIVAALVPFALGVACLINEKFSWIQFALGFWLVVLAIVLFALRTKVFRHMDTLFEGRDRNEDDAFYAQLCRRYPWGSEKDSEDITYL